MRPFDDLTASLDEPKLARMEQRMRPHVKAAIEQAAALMGVDTTAFVTNAAYEHPRETLKSHELTVLHAADRDGFLAALENPPLPSDELRKALRLHDARVVNDECSENGSPDQMRRSIRQLAPMRRGMDDTEGVEN